MRADLSYVEYGAKEAMAPAAGRRSNELLPLNTIGPATDRCTISSHLLGEQTQKILIRANPTATFSCSSQRAGFLQLSEYNLRVRRPAWACGHGAVCGRYCA